MSPLTQVQFSEAGDPCSPLRWICKSVQALTDELVKREHKTCTRMVHELLVELRYTMQGNKRGMNVPVYGPYPDVFFRYCA